MSSKNALFFISDSRDDIREQLLPCTILALGTDHNGKVAVIQNANSVNQLKMTSYSSTSSLNHSSNYFPLVNGVTKVLPGIFEFLCTGLYRGLNCLGGQHLNFKYQYRNFPFSKSYQFSRIFSKSLARPNILNFFYSSSFKQSFVISPILIILNFAIYLFSFLQILPIL